MRRRAMAGEWRSFRELVQYAVGGGWGDEAPLPDTVPVRVIRGTDFTNIASGAFDEVPRRFEARAKVQRRLLQPDDIVLEISGGSRTSNQSTGRTLFVTQQILDQLGGDVIPASFCRLVRLRDELVIPRYVYYALREMYSSGRAETYEHHSTGISNFQFKYFLDNERVRVPPLPEQRAIAHILGALDDKIELNRRMSQTLEQMARALFKAWFVDFEPVRAKMEGRWQRGQSLPGLPAHLYDLFPDRLVESELGEIPEGWEVRRLGEVIDTIKGRSYRSEELVESDTALVTLKSFARGGGYRPDGLKPFAGTYKPEQVVEPGELIIACTDVTQAAEVIGRPAIVLRTDAYRRLVASLDTLIVRPRGTSITRSFLYFLCGTEAFVAHAFAHTTGTTVLHLAKEAVPSFIFAQPSTELVKRFDTQAGTVLHRMQALEEESRTLAALRDTLLPKLISGVLRVTDAERFLEGRGL